ncbi:hypothetical protein [Gallaecimonas xiamenensis]|uniref:Peptidyl-prolyl cis-trans isomerase n=1 Tax=Gallaecimonas xiamenensis 3-C-1 TaxID=745411 RepID=K2J1K2_9GAMM|nr:hypothetical protein [Gallaecimonas xiamenensis]EKE68652.1 hypothetical protein B3C1_16526 [Gallaecimonas xiamenensis 3-C-1]
MANVLKSPLLHFLLIGAGLFTLYGWLVQGQASIAVDRAALSAQFQRLWARPPSSAELQDLVDQYLLEEIAVRRAQALGLDRDDPVIRARLWQKMQFLDDALPSDQELADFLDRNQGRYQQPARYRLSYWPKGAGQGQPEEWSATLVAGRFGQAWLEQLNTLAPGQWQPLPDGGRVQLLARQDGYLPALGELRSQLLADWQGEQRQARQALLLAQYREQQQ